MSVPPVPSEQPAGARTRPGTVTAAAILMFLITAVSLVFAALTIISAAVLSDADIRRELERQQPDLPSEQLDATVALFKPSQYAAGALLVVFAIVLAVLAVLVFKGSRVGRILTWVVTGLYAFCGLCLAGGAVGNSAAGGGVLGLIIPLLLLLGSLGVIILLALPVSNPYFAKPVPQWQPPAELGTELSQTPPPPGTTPGTPTPAAPPPAPPAAPSGPDAPPAPQGEPPSGETPPSGPR